MIPAPFRFVVPATLQETIALLVEHGEEARLLAGGQSLLPLMKLRLASPSVVIDLGHLAQLGGIHHEELEAISGTQSAAGVASPTQIGSAISIGAMTPYYRIEESSLIRTSCPLLAQTASVVADVQVRNRGTIGGSLAHADPTGDMAAAILALDAAIIAVGPSGQRSIPAERFFSGLFSTALAAEEVLTAVRVPALSGWSMAYAKAAPRASSFAIAAIAVCLREDANHRCQEIRVGVTGVSDKPYRAYHVESALRGNALTNETIAEAASSIVDGIWVADDVRASRPYREHLARVYAARAIQAARDKLAAN